MRKDAFHLACFKKLSLQIPVGICLHYYLYLHTTLRLVRMQWRRKLRGYGARDPDVIDFLPLTQPIAKIQNNLKKLRGNGARDPQWAPMSQTTPNARARV